MNVALCIRMCREVFAGKAWFLLEHGTVIVGTDVSTDADIVAAMRLYNMEIGPYGGEGSPLGDVNPMRLKAFDGWLVGFSIPLVTFVGADETERPPTSPTEVMQVPEGGDRKAFAEMMRVALLGRHKRNLDASHPKIIASSTTVMEN